MADELKVPEEGETKEPPKVEVKTETPPVEKTPEKIVDEIPDKFKGKSAEEIIKSYNELEKTLGNKVNKEDFDKADKELKEWQQLGLAIKNNEKLMKALEEEFGQKEVKVEEKDDVRETLRTGTIATFEKSYGIDSLSKEDGATLRGKIGQELKEMLDPDGQKTIEQVINDIPLNRLPSYLNKAYRNATYDDVKERARIEALVTKQQNNDGIIGNISSTSSKSDTVDLSPEQRNVAKKLGISEEKYIEQLKKIEAN